MPDLIGLNLTQIFIGTYELIEERRKEMVTIFDVTGLQKHPVSLYAFDSPWLMSQSTTYELLLCQMASMAEIMCVRMSKEPMVSGIRSWKNLWSRYEASIVVRIANTETGQRIRCIRRYDRTPYGSRPLYAYI